jgi:hypothetical protein
VRARIVVQGHRRSLSLQVGYFWDYAKMTDRLTERWGLELLKREGSGFYRSIRRFSGLVTGPEFSTQVPYGEFVQMGPGQYRLLAYCTQEGQGKLVSGTPASVDFELFLGPLTLDKAATSSRSHPTAPRSGTLKVRGVAPKPRPEPTGPVASLPGSAAGRVVRRDPLRLASWSPEGPSRLRLVLLNPPGNDVKPDTPVELRLGRQVVGHGRLQAIRAGEQQSLSVLYELPRGTRGPILLEVFAEGARLGTVKLQDLSR